MTPSDIAARHDPAVPPAIAAKTYEIPLDQLELAPENVRKTPAGAGADSELKASLAAHGLLENLVVRPLGAGSDGGGRYAVTAGGRRLAALQALAAEGAIEADFTVRCLSIDNAAVAAELSLAENSARAAMHPADQVEAFAALAGAGATVPAIAARFGVSERLVQQRLRLGGVAPTLLAAYRAEEIDMETLAGFTINPDTGRQMAAWEQLSAQGYRPRAWQIRELLTEDRIPAGSDLVRFVGLEAYRAAGGNVERDLFADDRRHDAWLTDTALLRKLAMAKLDATALALRGQWAWVEARLEFGWEDRQAFTGVQPEPGAATEDEAEELDRLDAREDALLEALGGDEPSAGEAQELACLEERRDAIHAAVEARAVWPDGIQAVAGCIVTVGHGGEAKLVPGLVKPEDDAALQALLPGDAAPGGGGGQISGAVPRTDPRAAALKAAGVGAGLADDLRAIRASLIKAHLARDFEAAFDLAVFQAARAAFAQQYCEHALDIGFHETAMRPTNRYDDDTFAAWSPGEAMLAKQAGGLPLDWCAIEDDGASFTAFRALPQGDKQALFAAAVAHTLKGQLAFEADARPELEATVARLDIDFADHLRPTAEMFFARVTKARLLDIAAATLGQSWATAYAKEKKATLATVLARAFAGGGEMPAGLDATARQAIAAWSLPGFRAFDSAGAPSAGADDTGKDDHEDPQTQETAPAGRAAAAEQASDNPSPSRGGGGKDTAPATPPALPAAGDVLPPDLAAEIEALDRIPTANGGARVIVYAVGFDDAARGGPDSQAARPSGTAAGDPDEDPLAIPAFLRRTG